MMNNWMKKVHLEWGDDQVEFQVGITINGQKSVNESVFCLFIIIRDF